MITIETIFATQVGSIIAFVVTLFVLYRVLVQQKDATIHLQKENTAYLKDQLTEARLQSPDVLAQSLASRVKLIQEELSRLMQDNSSTQEQIKSKEAELNQASEHVKELTEKMQRVREYLGYTRCPQCDAPLKMTRSHVDYKEEPAFGVLHECRIFECGCEIEKRVFGESGKWNSELKVECKSLVPQVTA